MKQRTFVKPDQNGHANAAYGGQGVSPEQQQAQIAFDSLLTVNETNRLLVEIGAVLEQILGKLDEMATAMEVERIRQHVGGKQDPGD